MTGVPMYVRRLLQSLALGIAVLSCPGGPALASDVAEVIANQVDMATYRHYLEDLLYTHLGHDRGFGPEHDLARENIVSVLLTLGLDVQLEPFVYNDGIYYNVVATQPGEEFPEEIYVVGAHYDSVDNPGADDNGTGTALVMEAARVLTRHRTPRTIKYILFDREEQGLRGSRAYVAAHPDEQFIMAVITDMVGHDSGAFAVDVYGTEASAHVVTGVADAVDIYGDDLGAFLNIRPFAASDHWPFEQAGIPACVVVEDCYSCNPYYHTPNDAVDVEPDYLDYDMLEGLVRSITAYLVDEVEISLYGDSDDDADVDLFDLAELMDCFGVGDVLECRVFDFDQDQDVDLDDHAAFVAVFAGPHR